MHSIIIELKSFDIQSISKIQQLIKKLTLACGIFSRISKDNSGGLPKKRKKFVFIRSPFVHKKSQEPFGLCMYTLIFKLQSTNVNSLMLVINYIQQNVHLNVECRITRKIKYSNH